MESGDLVLADAAIEKRAGQQDTVRAHAAQAVQINIAAHATRGHHLSIPGPVHDFSETGVIGACSHTHPGQGHDDHPLRPKPRL